VQKERPPSGYLVRSMQDMPINKGFVSPQPVAYRKTWKLCGDQLADLAEMA
jgi:hypothetical protein